MPLANSLGENSPQLAPRLSHSAEIAADCVRSVRCCPPLPQDLERSRSACLAMRRCSLAPPIRGIHEHADENARTPHSFWETPGELIAGWMFVFAAGGFFSFSESFFAQVQRFTQEPHNLSQAFNLGLFFVPRNHFPPMLMRADKETALASERQRPGRSGAGRAFSALDMAQRDESGAGGKPTVPSLYPRQFSRASAGIILAGNRATSARFACGPPLPVLPLQPL